MSSDLRTSSAPRPARRSGSSVGIRTAGGPGDLLVVDDRPEVIDPRPGGSIPHRPGLDGLRGLAVAAVVAHHFGYLPGGYLGVDLFFVLSGFLITSLLLAEARSNDRISLGAFWTRRARRLLPAVVVLLVATAIWARFGAAIADRPSLRREGIAGVFYMSNWEQIVSGVDYWDKFGALSPLRHLWSLAIEEQFYVVWPLVVALIVRRGGARWSIAAVATIGAVASEAARWLMFDPDEPTSRLYFGTDTRIAAIFFGVVAACMMASPSRARANVARRAVLEVAAIVSLLVLAVAWVGLEGTDPLLYRGGFTVCGIAATIAVVAAAHRRPGRVAAALSWSPFRWLGTISYGLYLWHWPVVAVLDEQRMGFGGLPLAAVWTVVSLGLAVVSFHVIETPIRRGSAVTRLGVLGRPTRAAFVAVGVTAMVGVTWWGTSLSPAEARAVERAEREVGEVDDIPDDLVADPTTPNASNPPVASTSPPSTATPERGATAAFEPYPVGTEPRLMIVGDSVADSIAAPMQAANGSTGATVLNRSLVGCPLISSMTKERTTDGQIMPDREVCTTWRSVWTEGIKKFQPNAALLVLGAANSADRWLSGEWHAPCSAEVTDWLTERVGDAIDLLAPSVDRVAVATTPMTAGMAHKESDVETIACKNDAIRAAVASRPAARVIDLNEWVCPDGECRLEISKGQAIRLDGMHFVEGPAALGAGEWILQQFGVVTP